MNGRLTRTITAAGAALGAVALVLLAASPAVAVPRPIADHDGLFAIDCDESSETQLYSVDPLTAAMTPIGTGTVHGDGNECAAQPAWNAATKTAYFILWDYIDGALSFLATMDLATGQSTLINPTFEGDDTLIEIDSMAITPAGAAYAWAGDDFFSLDLATAELTYIATSTIVDIWGFAADPRNGTLYAINEEGDLYTINPADGVATSIGNVDVDLPDPGILSLQVDSAGVLWLENDILGDGGYYSELWTVLNDATVEEYHGDFDLAYTEAILIVPGYYTPVLPATGIDATPLLALGAGVVVLGGALVLLRRRTVRS